MADRLRRAVADLTARLMASESRDIVYSRGAASLSLAAVKGGVLLKLSEPDGGVRMLRTQDDYVFTAADLGELGTPEPGDCVQDGLEGKVYEVCPPGGGEGAWRYTDATHVLVRVHTKEVLP